MSTPAVIFDLDGVLVDSLGALYGTYLRFLAAHGVEGNEAEFERLNGPTLAQIIATLKADHGIDGEATALLQEYRGYMTEAYASLHFIEGMAELVRELRRAGLTLAVASAASRDQIQGALQAEALTDCFQVVVSGQDVSEGKPHPAIYRAAHQQLGAPPCLVVEDSGHGLQAAETAGLPVVQSLLGGAERKRPDAVESLAALRDRIWQQLLQARFEPAPQVRVVAGEPFAPDAELTGKVDALWEAACKERPHLFDGRVVCCRSRARQSGTVTVTACVVPYRYVYAHHLLGVELGLQPMGVSARLRDGRGRTLLGKRRTVTEYPEHWELVPCGNLDAPASEDGAFNPLQTLHNELKEEAGIDLRMLYRVRSLGLLDDLAHDVLDLCFDVELHAAVDLEALAQQGNGGEHSLLRCQQLDTAADSLAGEAVIPTSRLLLSLPA